MSDELIKNRIALLTPEYQDFITGDHLAEIIQVYTEAENLDVEKAAYFENGLMLYLLFFITAEELKDFVSENCELNRDTANSLVDATINSLPEGFSALYNQAAELFLSNNTNNPIAPMPQVENVTYQNPLVRPVPQSPYAEVPTYQSSQEDIYPIRKRPDANQQWGAE